MNYDSFYDSIKSIGDLTFKQDGVDSTIILPFVADIKKVNLIIEKEEVFMEGTHLEVEGKSLEIFGGSAVDIEFNKNLKTMFGALLTQNGSMGKLNVAKIGCPLLEVSEEDKLSILSFLDDARMNLDEATKDIILKTSGHMDVHYEDTLTYLKNGITYFGGIFTVENMMKTFEVSRQDLIDQMCNKSDLDMFFNRFMEAVEMYYTAVSTANLAQINTNGN